MLTDKGARVLLRLEGLAFAAIALFFYSIAGAGWLVFALLILVPDLSMLFYLAGPRFGRLAYNLVHTYLAPVTLGAIGWFGNFGLLLAIALIWVVHIGIDRALGLGLKLGTFRETHLGRIGN
jgi:hypothetical protein